MSSTMSDTVPTSQRQKHLFRSSRCVYSCIIALLFLTSSILLHASASTVPQPLPGLNIQQLNQEGGTIYSSSTVSPPFAGVQDALDPARWYFLASSQVLVYDVDQGQTRNLVAILNESRAITQDTLSGDLYINEVLQIQQQFGVSVVDRFGTQPPRVLDLPADYLRWCNSSALDIMAGNGTLWFACGVLVPSSVMLWRMDLTTMHAEPISDSIHSSWQVQLMPIDARGEMLFLTDENVYSLDTTDSNAKLQVAISRTLSCSTLWRFPGLDDPLIGPQGDGRNDTLYVGVCGDSWTLYSTVTGQWSQPSITDLCVLGSSVPSKSLMAVYRPTRTMFLSCAQQTAAVGLRMGNDQGTLLISFPLVQQSCTQTSGLLRSSVELDESIMIFCLSDQGGSILKTHGYGNLIWMDQQPVTQMETDAQSNTWIHAPNPQSLKSQKKRASRAGNRRSKGRSSHRRSALISSSPSSSASSHSNMRSVTSAPDDDSDSMLFLRGAQAASNLCTGEMFPTVDRTHSRAYWVCGDAITVSWYDFDTAEETNLMYPSFTGFIVNIWTSSRVTAPASPPPSPSLELDQLPRQELYILYRNVDGLVLCRVTNLTSFALEPLLPPSKQGAITAMAVTNGWLVYQVDLARLWAVPLHSSLTTPPRLILDVSRYPDAFQWATEEASGRILAVVEWTMPPVMVLVDVVQGTNTTLSFPLNSTLQCSLPRFDTPYVANASEAGDPRNFAQNVEFICYPNTRTAAYLVTYSLARQRILSTVQVCATSVSSWSKNAFTGGYTIACNDITPTHQTAQYVIGFSRMFSCFPGATWDTGGCSLCPASTASPALSYYDAQVLVSDCASCDGGDVQPSDGGLECMPCPVGQYQDAFVPLLCSGCAPGKSNNQTGQMGCTDCDVGRYAESTSAINCQACATGTAVNSTGSPFCLICAAGFNAEKEGSAVCSPCPKGYYTPSVQYSTCVACSAGTFTDAEARTYCQPCDRGTFSNETGRTSACDECPLGAEQPFFGMTSCLFCLPGAVSPTRGDPCATCSANTYASIDGTTCLSCVDSEQEGLQCTNGRASVLEGFWAYLVYDEDHRQYVYHTTECPQSYCPGTKNLPPATLNGTIPFNASATDGDGGIVWCEFPRLNHPSNYLCAQCDSGYILWGQSCEPCTGPDWSMIFLVTIVCFLLVGFLLRTSSSSSSGGSWTILLFFIQTAALEVGPVMPAIDWIQWTNLGATSTRRCIAPLTPLQQMLITLAMPLILIGVLGVIALTHIVIRSCCTKRRPPTSSSSLPYRFLHSLTAKISTSRYIGCCSAILLFAYTSVTVTCIRALRCVNITATTELLFQAPTVDCRSEEYRHRFLPVVYVVVVIYCIGLPLGILLLLWRKRSLLLASAVFDRTSGEEETVESTLPAVGAEAGSPPASSAPFSPRTFHSMRRFQTRLGPFYRMYRPSVWYWTSLRLLMRLSYVLTAVLLSTSPASKFALFSGLAVLGGVAQEWIGPFGAQKLNRIEVCSFLCLVALSLVLSSSPPPFSLALQLLLFLLIVPFTLYLVYLTGKVMWERMKAMVGFGDGTGGGAKGRRTGGSGSILSMSSSSSVVRFSDVVCSYDAEVDPPASLAYDSDEEEDRPRGAVQRALDDDPSGTVLARPSGIQVDATGEIGLEHSRSSYRAMEEYETKREHM